MRAAAPLQTLLLSGMATRRDGFVLRKRQSRETQGSPQRRVRGRRELAEARAPRDCKTAGDDGRAFRAAMEAVILPRLRAFRPDLVIVSAGFDAHARDPLAQINLTEEDFAWATGKLMDLAQASAGGRLVSLLEGGYDLIALARSVEAHVATLMGRRAPARG